MRYGRVRVLGALALVLGWSGTAGAVATADDNAGTWIDPYTDVTGLAPVASGLTDASIALDGAAGLLTLAAGETSGTFATTVIDPASSSGWGKVYLDATFATQGDITAQVLDAQGGVLQTLALAPSDTAGYTLMAPITAAAADAPIRVSVTLTKVGAIAPTVSALEVTWTPLTVLAVTLAPQQPTACSAATMTFRVGVSASFVDAKDVVVVAPLPTPGANDTAQDTSVSFVSATQGGQVTGAAPLTVHGVTVPANSVYWDLGTRHAGETFGLFFTVRTNQGLLDQMTYTSSAQAFASNGAPASAPEATVTISSTPGPYLDKEPSVGAYRIAGQWYAEAGTVLGYRLAGWNYRTAGQQCGEELFQAIVFDDVSDLVGKIDPAYGTGGFDVAQGGQYTASGFTQGCVTVPPHSVWWDLSSLTVGEHFSLDYTVSLLPTLADGTTVDNQAWLRSSRPSQCGDQAQDGALVTIGIPDDPHGNFAKGDEIRGTVGITAGNDNAEKTVTYGDVFSWYLRTSNDGASALDDLVMLDRIPDAVSFLSASLPGAVTGEVYYHTGDGADWTDAPDFDPATGALTGGWTTTAPADPSTVRWVAFRVDHIASRYFPEAGVDSAATGKITVQVNPPAQACDEFAVTNRGLFHVYSYTPLGAAAPQMIDGGGISVTNDEVVNVAPRRPDLSHSTLSDSPTDVRVGESVTYHLFVNNMTTAQNPIDPAYDVEATIHLPTVDVNGVPTILQPSALNPGTGGSVDYSQAASGVVRISYASLPPGASRHVVMTLPVPRGVLDGASFNLGVDLTANDDDCGSVSAHLAQTTTTFGSPYLQVSKSTDLSVGAPDTEVHMTLRYVNTGRTPSRKTWLVDAILPGWQLVDAAAPVFPSTPTDVFGEVWFSDDPALPAYLSMGYTWSDAVIHAHFQPGTLDAATGRVAPPAGMDPQWVAFLVDDPTLAPAQLATDTLRSVDMTLRVVSTTPGEVLFNRAGITAQSVPQSIGNKVRFTVSADPSLKLDKTGPEVAPAESTVTYQVAFYNDSTNHDSNVVITDTLPAELDLATVTTSWTWNAAALANDPNRPAPAIDVNGDQVTVSIASLDSLEGGTLTITATVLAGTTSGTLITNQVAGSAENDAGVVTSVFDTWTTLVQNADLYTRKLADTADPRATETVTYRLVLSNEGAWPADDVVLTDTLPAGMTYVANSATVLTSGWSVQGGSPEPVVSGQTLTWSVAWGNALTHAGDAPGVFPGHSGDVVISFVARVDAGTPPGTPLENTATATTPTGQDPDYPDTGTVTVTTPLPDLYVDKTGPPLVQPGTVVTYTTTYGNDSKEPAPGACLIERLPDGPTATDGQPDVQFVSALASHGETLSFHTVALDQAPPSCDDPGWLDATQAAGQTVTYVKIDAGDLGAFDGPYEVLIDLAIEDPTGLPLLAGTQFEGCVSIAMTAAGAPADDDPTNNEACVLSRTPGVDVALDLTSDPQGAFPGALPGSTATFTFVVENTGTVEAHGLKIVDPLPPTVAFLSDSSAAVSIVDADGDAVTPIGLDNARLGQSGLTVPWTHVGDTWYLGAPEPTAGDLYYRRLGLLPGDKATLTVTVQVLDAVPNATPVTNVATVVTDYREDFDPAVNEQEELLANNTDEDGFTVFRADPFVDKSVTNATSDAAGSDSTAMAGDTLHYTLEYGNAGDFAAEGVVLEDMLPADVTFIVGSLGHIDPATMDVLYDDGSGTWSYQPTGPTGSLDPNVRGVRVVWTSPLPAPANVVFAATTTPQFDLGTYDGTTASDGGSPLDLVTAGSADLCANVKCSSFGTSIPPDVGFDGQDACCAAAEDPACKWSQEAPCLSPNDPLPTYCIDDKPGVKCHQACTAAITDSSWDLAQAQCEKNAINAYANYQKCRQGGGSFAQCVEAQPEVGIAHSVWDGCWEATTSCPTTAGPADCTMLRWENACLGAFSNLAAEYAQCLKDESIVDDGDVAHCAWLAPRDACGKCAGDRCAATTDQFQNWWLAYDQCAEYAGAIVNAAKGARGLNPDALTLMEATFTCDQCAMSTCPQLSAVQEPCKVPPCETTIDLCEVVCADAAQTYESCLAQDPKNPDACAWLEPALDCMPGADLAADGTYTSPVFPADGEGTVLQWQRAVIHDATEEGLNEIHYAVLDGQTGLPIPGYEDVILDAAGVVDLSGIDPSAHPTLQLQATLSGTKSSPYYEVGPLGEPPLDCAKSDGGIATGAMTAISPSGVWATGSKVLKPGGCEYGAIRWSDATGLEELNDYALTSSWKTIGYAVNDQGWVAGEMTTVDGELQPFIWSGQQPVAAKDLPVDAIATGINNSGVVVGWQLQGGGDLPDLHVFTWANGVLTDRGVVPGQGAGRLERPTYLQINEASQIAGSATYAGTPYHGVFFAEPGGALTAIVPPTGAGSSTFADLAANGNVCGTISMNLGAQTLYYAFAWEHDTQNLRQAPTGDPQNPMMYRALACNDTTVVGYGTPLAGGSTTPFIWDLTTDTVTLVPLVDAKAGAINDAGQVGLFQQTKSSIPVPIGGAKAEKAASTYKLFRMEPDGTIQELPARADGLLGAQMYPLAESGHVTGYDGGHNGWVWPKAGAAMPALLDWTVLYQTDQNPSVTFDAAVNPACVTSIANTATVTTVTPEISEDNDSSTATIGVQPADLQVSLAVTPSVVHPGETVTLTATITNDGPGPIADATGSMGPLPAGWTLLPGATTSFGPTPLAAGESASVKVEATAPTVAAAGTTGSFGWTVGTKGADCDAANDADSVTVVIGDFPDLWVTVDCPETAPAGGEITCTVHYGNNGNAPVDEVALTEVPPADATVTGSTPDLGTLPSGDQGWTLGTLNPGDTGSTTVTFTVPGCDFLGAELANQVSIASLATNPTEDANAADNQATGTTTVTDALGHLVHAAVASRATVEGGDEITYTIYYANDGGGMITDATIEAQIPAGTTLTADATATSLTYPLGDLEPGDSGSVRFTVAAGAGPATLAGGYDITGGGTCPADGVYDVVAVTAPGEGGVHVVKSADTNVACGAAGAEIAWTLTVSNTTPTPQTVTLTDELAANALYVPGSIVGQGADDSAAPLLTWDLGTLAPGAALTVGYATTVGPAGDAFLANQAQGKATSGAIASPVALVATHCEATATLVKSLSAACALPGGGLAVTLTYANQTGAPLSGVVVTDTVPAQMTVVDAGGATVGGSGTLTWTVGDLAPGQTGTLTYTMAVNADAPSGSLYAARASLMADGLPPQTSNQVAGAILGCEDGSACTVDACDALVGCVSTLAPDGTACDDGDLCTQTDTCTEGLCVGSNPVVCAASDDCHVAGTCNPATGTCDDPPAEDGTPCEDGDLCTLADTCAGGVCQAGEAKPCEAPNACFAVTGCNAATGECELAPVADAGQGPITLTALGTLGGVTSTPHALNDAGVVVGESADDTGAAQAFRWEAGTLENIAPTLADGAAVSSAATAIDPAGHIAGWVEAPDGTTSVFHRDAAGDEILWAIESSTDSRFLPVVANDWVAGVGTDAGAHTLNRVQGMEGGWETADLSALAAAPTDLHVAGVTDTGVVAGDLTLNGTTHAFVWTADALTVLTPADMAASKAVGISGDLVAVQGTRADGTHAALAYTVGDAADALTALDAAADTTVVAVEGARFLGTRGDGAASGVVIWDWDAATSAATATDLTLPAGGAAAVPVALNAAGHAVATYTTAFGATNTLFWAPEDGAAPGAGVTDIGTLGGATTRAVALSDGDHVVVAATTAGGAARAAIWWPGAALRDLGVLPGTTTVAPVAVNAAGQAVGVAAYDGDDRGWISTAPETSCVVCSVDTGAPELTCPVYAAPIECAGAPMALDADVALGSASAWDACGQPVTLANDAPATFPVGTTPVTWTATDAAGNTSSCVSNVTIVDTTPPVLTCPEAHEVTPDDGVCGAALALTPTVDDACDPDGVTLVSDAPALFPVGTTTVTFTAVDAAGNQATCTTDVTVGAGQPRAITCDPDVSFEVPADACQVDEVLTAQVVDQCTPTVTLTADTRAYSVGEHDVIFTADEGTASPLSCTTHLTVTDGTAPTVACNAPATLANADLPAVIRATGEDNCAAAVTVADATCVDAEGNAVDGCTVTMDGDTVKVVVDATAVPEGTTVSYAVSWTATATDPSGNATTVDCSTTAEVTGNAAQCGPGQVRNEQGECVDVEIPEPTCAPGWSLNEDGICDKIVANGGGGCEAGWGGAGALPWLAALLVLGWFARRRRRSAGKPAAAAVATALVVMTAIAAPGARAQSNPLDGNVPAQLFEPAPGGTLNYVGVQSMQVLKHLDVAGGFYLNYAYEPLVLHRLSNGEQVDLLQHQLQLDATAAFGLFDVLELGVSVPVTLFQQAGDAGRTLSPNENLASTVMGDLRVYPKWKIFGPDKKAEGFGLALLAVLSVPSGDKEALQGVGGVTLEPRVAAEYLFSDTVRVAATLGYRVRFADDQQLFNIQVGNELTYGMGFEWRPDLGNGPEKWAVMLDLNGKVVADPDIDAQAEERPVELALAGRYWPVENHAITFGLGRGLSQGYGTPGVRVFAGYNYTPAPVRDADGDGLVDRDDSCPMEPEDVDSFQDDDGCPDLDNDKDGLPDVSDKCPMEAEDKDGFQDDDGCPDVDNDGDGILDDVDKCPDEAEDKDGIDDEDGCPETDGDGDGVLDEVDKCPNEAEDMDEVFDEDGCPETDGDSDGILDPEDACPTEPENKNGVADDDGCPDVNEQKCVIDLPKIHFKYDKAKIQKRSYSVLDDAVAVLKSYPDVKLVEIGGHTDSDGTARYNQKLSAKRAKAVVKYLKKHGIKGSRLRAVGFGEYLPKVTPERTKKDKEKNRRVEFRVLKWKGRDCSAQVPGKILLKRALQERKARGRK